MLEYFNELSKDSPEDKIIVQIRGLITSEFYGILKTLPQSGTFVAGIGLPALEGLITDVLKLEKSDFKDLVETRVILESIIKQFISFKVCDETTELKALEDHQNILTAIINKDGEKASSFMEAHLEEVVTFSMVSVKDLA